MLSARKLTRDKIEQEARPPFGVLSALSQERSSIVEQSVKFAIEDGVAWCSLPTEQVPLEELERELVKYDALRDRIRSQKVPHNVALVLLRVCGTTRRGVYCLLCAFIGARGFRIGHSPDACGHRWAGGSCRPVQQGVRRVRAYPRQLHRDATGQRLGQDMLF